MHTVQDDTLLGSLKFVSKIEEYQVYGALVPEEMTNQQMQDSPAYKTYLAFAIGAATSKKAKKWKKHAFPTKKKTPPSGVQIRDAPGGSVSNKKTPTKAKRNKGIGLLSEAALLEEVQMKKAIKRSKCEKHLHQTGGSGDGAENEYESWGVSDDDDDQQDDEEYRKINEEMYDDVNVELKDTELADKGKVDEEMIDAEKINAEHDEVIQEDASTQVHNEAHVTPSAAPAQVASSSRSVSSNYVQHENLNIHSSSLLTVPVFVIPEPTILSSIPKTLTTSTATTTSPPIHPFIPHPQQSTQILTPTTTKATTLTPAVQESETLNAIHLRRHTVEFIKEHSVPADVVRVLKHQQKPQKSVEDIRKVKMEHAAKQQESRYTITSSDKAALKEFDQKRTLFERMTKSKSFEKNPKHRALYHALIESILEDEDAMDKGVADKKKTSKDAKPSKKVNSIDTSKGTTKSQPKSTGKSAQARETVFEAGDTQVSQNLGEDTGKIVDDGPTQNWLSYLAKAEKPSKTFNELMSTPINFTAFAMNRLQISDLTKVDLVGPVYNLLKGTCKSYVELEYKMENVTKL
ncbi:hypothetical protein Tco_1485174 [Tanacetum coccineum]